MDIIGIALTLSFKLSTYRNSLALGLLQPSRGPAVDRTPPRRNSLPSNGKSSKLPLLLRFNLPKRLRKPPKLLLLWLIDGDGDGCCGKSPKSSIIFSLPAVVDIAFGHKYGDRKQNKK